MNTLKWYHKILIAIAVILLLPLILVILLTAGIYLVLQIPKNKKEYKNSHYYKDFGEPYLTALLTSPKYRFYNSACDRSLPIQYIKGTSDGIDCFVYENTLFLLPDFDQINYDDEKARWQVDYDGEWVDFEESCQKLFQNLHGNTADYPVKLLVEREMFPRHDLNQVNLPECIFVTWSYERAFENEDSPLKPVTPQSTEDLYAMMLETPDLCGSFELAQDGLIHWNLYETIQVVLGVDPHDCYLGIQKTILGRLESGITHWHPTTATVYNEVCTLGKPGNVLVIRTLGGGASVLYMGDRRNCPYSPDKKYFGGKYYFLEAKE